MAEWLAHLTCSCRIACQAWVWRPWINSTCFRQNISYEQFFSPYFYCLSFALWLKLHSSTDFLMSFDKGFHLIEIHTPPPQSKWDMDIQDQGTSSTRWSRPYFRTICYFPFILDSLKNSISKVDPFYNLSFFIVRFCTYAKYSTIKSKIIWTRCP